jgi:tetratricopeptide (TPR) repeat protein
MPVDRRISSPAVAQKPKTPPETTEQGDRPSLDEKTRRRATALLTYAQAMRYAMQGDFNRAVEMFRKVIELDPQAPQPHVALAELSYRLRNTTDARREAEQALALDPGNADAHRLLGLIYREEALSTNDREKARKAVEEFRQVVSPDELDLEAWQSLAQMYALLGEEEKLKEALERWTSSDPTADQAFYRLALIYFDKRDYRRAAENAARALTIRPDSDYALVLAKSLLYQGHTIEALRTYREALDRDPSNSELRINFAEALIFAGKYDDAVEILRKILADQPRNIEALRLTAQAYRRAGRRSEAIETLRTALRGLETSESLELQFTLAQTFEEVGQVDDAVATYEGMLKALLNPDGSVSDRFRRAVEQVLTSLALAYRQAGRREDAFKTFERMRLILGPTSTRPDLLAIDTLREEQNYREMLVHAEQAARHYPQERMFKLLQAQALGGLGRLDEAVALLDGLLTGSTEDIEVLSTKAQVLSEAERYKEAEAAIQEALRRDPRNNMLLIQLSLTQERLNRFAEAEATLRMLLDRDPDNAVALNNLGYYLAERGERLQEALELIRRAVTIDPTNGAYLDSLGWVYFQLGQLDDAEHYLQQALIYQPRDATIHEHLGDLYLRKGKVEKAEQSFEHAYRLARAHREKKRIEEKLQKLKERRQ